MQDALLFFKVSGVRITSFLLLRTKNTATACFTDKNVVSNRGKVANALNQDVISARLKWFAQKLEQFVLVVSAESELCPVFQKY